MIFEFAGFTGYVTRKWGWEPIVVENRYAAWDVLQQDNSLRLLLYY
jgi:hypothetical protein